MNDTKDYRISKLCKKTELKCFQLFTGDFPHVQSNKYRYSRQVCLNPFKRSSEKYTSLPHWNVSQLSLTWTKLFFTAGCFVGDADLLHTVSFDSIMDVCRSLAKISLQDRKPNKSLNCALWLYDTAIKESSDQNATRKDGKIFVKNNWNKSNYFSTCIWETSGEVFTKYSWA